MSGPFLQITIFPASRHTSEHPHTVGLTAASTSSPTISAPVSNASTASTSPSVSAARSTNSTLSATSSAASVSSSDPQTHTSPTPSKASPFSRWSTALIQDVGARFSALRSGLIWPGAGRGEPTNSGPHNHQQACLRDSHGASEQQIARGWTSPLSPCFCDLCVKLAHERECEREVVELPCETPRVGEEAEESVTATFITLYESEDKKEDNFTHGDEAAGDREEQRLKSPVASEDSTHGGAAASPDTDQPSQQDRDNEIIATQDQLIGQLYDAVAARDHLITLQARQLDHYEAFANGRHYPFDREEVDVPPQRPNTPSSTSTPPSSPSSLSTTLSIQTLPPPEASSRADAAQADQQSVTFTPSNRQRGSDRLAAHRGSVMEAGVELDRTVVGGVEILQSGRGVRVWRRGG